MMIRAFMLLFLLLWAFPSNAQAIKRCSNTNTPCWSTATRPAAPGAGMFGYNTDTKILEFYNGSTWGSAVDGVVDVKAFGAVGTGLGATNDQTAINNAIAYAHTLGTATLKPVKVYFPPGIYNICGSINGTGWTDTVVPNNNGPAVTFDGYGAWIQTGTCFTAGQAVMDFTGSSLLKIQGFSIFSNCSGPGSLATTGIQIGRRKPGSSAQNNSIQDVAVEGCYSLTPFYLYASEIFVSKNLNTLAFGSDSRYNAIIDCDNHFNITSIFVSIDPGPVHASCAGMSFYGGSFQAVLSGGLAATNSVAMFISSDAELLTLDNVYLNTPTATCFQINADNVANTDRFGTIRIRAHCELTTIVQTFLFTGGLAALNIQDFHYADDNLFATGSLFAIGGGGIATVNINNMDMNIRAWQTGGAKVFDNPANYTASGRYTSLTSPQWNAPSVWSGTVCLAGSCYFTPPVVAFSSLPTCNAANKGAIFRLFPAAQISTPTYWTIAAAGSGASALEVPVMCDEVGGVFNWRYH